MGSCLPHLFLMPGTGDPGDNFWWGEDKRSISLPISTVFKNNARKRARNHCALRIVWHSPALRFLAEMIWFKENIWMLYCCVTTVEHTKNLKKRDSNWITLTKRKENPFFRAWNPSSNCESKVFPQWKFLETFKTKPSMECCGEYKQ